MRNLKRVLSLALASAMLFGMMVVGASAADTKKTLTDLDKVTNKEAVNLMVDLGVITGKPDGSYAPTETVDRATMSTLIYKIMTGSSDASAFKGTSSTLADVKGNWAEGFINYCGSTGIVTGDGTNFYPANKVTVAQAAKMLLVAIGYDAELSKYVNDAMWSVNIMRDAQKAGLLEGISQKSSDELTRDNAAKMIFNTLFTKTVTPKYAYDMGVKYLDEYKESLTTLGEDTFKLGKIEAIVTGIDAFGKATTTPLSTPVGDNSLLTGKLAANPEQVGSKVVAYYNTNTNKLVSTVLSTGSSTILGTSTAGTAIANLTTKGDRKFIAETDLGYTVYTNGVQTAGAIAIGSVVELVDNDKTGKADVIRITNKSVAKLTANPVVSNDTVTIPAIPGLSKVDIANVVGYADLQKNDVVLYVKIGNTFYLEKAAMVEGVMAAKDNNNKAIIGGVAYDQSGLLGTSFNKTAFADYTNTYAFYFDDNKSIVMAEKKTDSVTTAYANLADLALVDNTATGGLTGTFYVQGKLVFTDGTSEVVTISSINGVSVVKAGKAVADGLKYSDTTIETTATDTAVAKTYYYSDVTATGATAKYYGVSAVGDLTATTTDGNPASAGVLHTITNNTTNSDTAKTPAFAVKGQFYEYTKNSDGTYSLKNVATGNNTVSKLNDAASNAGKIVNGATLFDGLNIGNAGTTFVYAVTGTDGKVTITTYTGIANVPSTTANATNAGMNAVVKNAAGIATFVYVEVGSSVVSGVSNSDVVYITSNDYQSFPANGNVPAYVLQAAVLNGVATTVKLSTAETKGTIKSVSTVSNEVLTLKAFDGATATGIKGNAGNVLVAGNGTTTIVYNDDTEVYYIGGDPVSSSAMSADAIALSATNVLYYQMKGTVASKIYVVEASAAPTALTIKAGTSNTGLTIGTANLLNTTAPAGGSITAWKAGNQVMINTMTPAANTKILNITIDGQLAEKRNDDGTYAHTDVALRTGTLVVVVTVQDDFSNGITTYSYNLTVPTVTAP